MCPGYARTRPRSCMSQAYARLSPGVLSTYPFPSHPTGFKQPLKETGRVRIIRGSFRSACSERVLALRRPAKKSCKTALV